MSSPMFELSEHEWREVDIDATRRVCPYAARADVGCSIAYFVDGDGRWVKDCPMAGIGSECVWAHPEKELSGLLDTPITADQIRQRYARYLEPDPEAGES